MEKTRNRLAESKPEKHGVYRDLDRLQTDGNASIGELREFMGRMQGKSPQEMLGVVAQSRLAMSIVWSTVGCAVLLMVLTVGPYLLKPAAADNKSDAKKSKQSASVNNNTGGGTPAVAGKTGNVPPTKTSDIAKKLGHTDTKTGTPDNLEKLLDGDK